MHHWHATIAIAVDERESYRLFSAVGKVGTDGKPLAVMLSNGGKARKAMKVFGLHCSICGVEMTAKTTYASCRRAPEVG